MRFYADLHIHSKYSRATSKDCDLEHLSWWAQRKGVTVVGTGDFTHPAWFEELKSKLVPAEPGLFRLLPELERAVTERLPKACRREATRFMLSVEISTIYKKGERTRKIHHLVYAPDFATAERFRVALGRIGNLASDGRPILGLDSRHLLQIVLESGPGAYLVPAHIWTPWFAVLGSKSGFDAVDECYGDLAPHVFAVETGLSSDPRMNWRVTSLDRFRLVSNSDAHSPPMLGREASVFDSDLDYFALRRALETGEGYQGSIEFFPEEGKYHLDGHRKCGVRLEPQQSRALGGRCPVCSGPLTIGVLSRVEELATRRDGEAPPNADPFRSLVALPEVMGEILGVGAKSIGVERNVSRVVEQLGPELEILEQVPLEEIRRHASPLLGEAVERIRAGRVLCEGGYDGEYGVVRVFEQRELRREPSVPLFEEKELRREPGVAPPFEDESDPAKRAIAAPAAPSGSSKAHTRPPAPGVAAESAPRVGPVQVSLPNAVSASSPATDDRAPASLLDDLDPDQRAAAEIDAGPLLIVAGPGTGKTRTLTYRSAELVSARGVAPERCLCVTFTRRAAGEMRERLSKLVPDLAAGITVTTFHGLGLLLMTEQRTALGLHRGFRVADPDTCVALVRQLFGHGERAARDWLEALSRTRRSAQVLDAEQDRYRQALWAEDLVDFDDLVELPAALLESASEIQDHYRSRFCHISVDEYQDIDALQYRLLRALVPSDGNLCAIGDPDQAIYGFRGAEVGFFLRFMTDFPGARRVHLGRNYRSTPAIVNGAVQAIAPATLVRDRNLTAARLDAGQRIAVHPAASERAEAEFVVSAIECLLGGTSLFSIDSGRAGAESENYSFSDFAVLYRTDAQSHAVVEALARSGIPYQKRAHDRLIDRPDVKALLRRLRQVDPAGRGPREWVEAVLDDLKREQSAFDGAVVLDHLTPWLDRPEADCDGFVREIVLGAEVDSWDPRADRVSLLTLHAAKGLEFEVVFVVGAEDGLLPFAPSAPARPADVAEERRLFFVGMTRARSRLVLCHARRRTLYGKTLEARPSPFLRDIDDLLLELTKNEAPSGKPKVPREDGQLSLF